MDAIESILWQTYKNWELLIVDDQSTDNTWEVIRKYENKDSRVRCLKNPNKGANFARNLGIANAAGKYIAFLDDDDISMQHRFESQYNAMRNSGARFIVSWYEIRDRSNGKLIKVDKKVHKSSEVGFPSRWMIEKSLLEEVGGFNPIMVAMQEIELSFRLAQKYTFAHHHEVVSVIYNTPDSTSSNDKAIFGKLQLLDEVGSFMLPVERANWNLLIALDFYKKGNIKNAKKHFKHAAHLNSNIVTNVIYYYFLIINHSKSILFKKLNCKIIKYLNQIFTPYSVNHNIV